MFIEKSELENFADDNKISASARNIHELVELLESESNVAINWFKNNGITANADKFHAIIINRCGRNNDLQKICLDSTEIESEESVELLGIKIDSKLNLKSTLINFAREQQGN